MSKIEKEIERLKSKPKDFTYDQIKVLLNKLGFIEDNKGKTSGSRVVFINKNKKCIELHKPHPKNILKAYQINKILKSLEEWRIL
ncbi:MAG: type II toxin-antitoxin system HicA family toxin [Candidatus Scatovivens sp.]